MWHFEILGMNLYQILQTFILFSFLGFVMECVVLSIETKKLVTNRGFMKGPFCIIYGFGALFIPALLRPVSHNAVLLFISGMVLATLFEYLTGMAMLRLFGSFWWDYSGKHFNYRGMLCLESSIGWGVLAVLYFRVLQGLVAGYINAIPPAIGKAMCILALIYFPLDFGYHLVKRLRARRGEDITAMDTIS